MDRAETASQGTADANRERTYPALTKLGLDRDDLLVLQRNGYLTRDNRGHGHASYWRLRFRRDGRQRTLYVGRDPLLVAAVQQELHQLQQPCRQKQALAQLVAAARNTMRQARQRLEPVLHQHGYHFHGHAIRQSRGARMTPVNQMKQGLFYG